MKLKLEIPAEEIPKLFRSQKRKLKKTKTKKKGLVKQLLAYMEDTWINSTTWKPENWSVYNQSIRTNNDTEGMSCL